MNVAVVGGTGMLGRHVARELRERGHEVRILSRRSPDHRVDLTTGEGLVSCLAGCDVVVDASNDSSTHAAWTLVEGTARLAAAEVTAGVRHHVGVSVVGCERVPMGYFRVKAEQERAVERGAVPWSLVRATQFHEHAAAMLASAARWRAVPLPRARIETVSCAEVARVVADVAEGPPRRGRVTVAGPEVVAVREVARTWRALTGRRALLIPVPLPGRAGRALRAGALTAERPDIRGTTRFEPWLAAQRQGRASSPA